MLGNKGPEGCAGGCYEKEEQLMLNPKENQKPLNEGQKEVMEFIRTKLDISGTKMIIRAICPKPIEPKCSHQYFRVNYYKKIESEQYLIAYQKMVASAWVEIEYKEGALSLVNHEVETYNRPTFKD